MFPNPFYILCLTLLSINSQTESLAYIKENYCEIYCAGKCKDNNRKIGDKWCKPFKNVIRTDNYILSIKNSSLSISIGANFKLDNLVDLESTDGTLNMVTVLNDNPSSFNTGVQYLKRLGLVGINKFYNNFSNYIQVEERSLNAHRNGPKEVHLYLYGEEILCSHICNLYIMQLGNDLKSIFINGNDGLLSLFENIFQDKRNLSLLEFNSFKLEIPSPTIFQNLTNLKKLVFENVTDFNQSILVSSTLQSNLEVLHVCIHTKFDLRYLQDYRKLILVVLRNLSTDSYIPNNNLNAFICPKTDSDGAVNCTFTLGINGIRCPKGCRRCWGILPNGWQVEEFVSDLRFIVSCTGAGLYEIPDLPIPIFGYIVLHFEKNKLRQLPNHSVPGYKRVKELYLTSNYLTSLSMDQLPVELAHLDLRNNTLTADTLKDLSSQWNASSENVFVTKAIKSLSHHTPCPSNCFCYFDDRVYYIDCSNQSLSELPNLKVIAIGNSSLRLGNNNLKSLPNNSLWNPKLLELHLSNNQLTHLFLEQLPTKIRYLDIRNNQLTTLDDKVIQFLKYRLTFGDLIVQMSGNPWHCYCNSSEFLIFLRQHEPKVYARALRNYNIEGDCPNQCICCLTDNPMTLDINCTNKRLEIISNYPKLPHNFKLSLRFKGNQLRTINISDFNNITYLDIRNNNLSTLSPQLVDSLIERYAKSPLSLLISGNQWICNCKQRHFLRFIKIFTDNIDDLNQVKCWISDSKTMVKAVSIEERDVCPSVIPYYVGAFVMLFIFAIAMNSVIYNRKLIQMWLYEKNVFMVYSVRKEMDKKKKFDAFLAYCHKDSHFVEEYVRILEKGPHKFKLCFYERNFLPGSPIPDLIFTPVEESKRTIILMTKHFMNSVWGRLEFRMALQATSRDRCKRLIVIVYPDVENFDDLDGELRRYLAINTYLRRNDPNFWSKLIYAMPHEAVSELRGQLITFEDVEMIETTASNV